MSVCGATVAGPKAQVGECVPAGEAGCDVTGWEGEGSEPTEGPCFDPGFDQFASNCPNSSTQ